MRNFKLNLVNIESQADEYINANNDCGIETKNDNDAITNENLRIYEKKIGID